ncbi:MAG: DEAD/DEAH box helicase family protein [Thermoflexales bacterium]|nr:DEAD/DEAH box helicase family protein [Thermoflexales bacterium]
MPDGLQQYVKLENRLILLSWLNDLLGYKSNRELLEGCKAANEGFGPDGRSFLYHHLIARGSQVKIPTDDLARYDENIRLHLEKINRGRAEKITLRYFQYLAALYTEIFLDRLFKSKAQLLADLNAFVDKRNARRSHGEPQEEPFSEKDLNKLAYWMATGSGKTLLLHLNYYQYLHYNRDPLDNILLITPNEGLSEQHLAELKASGIPAQRFDLNAGGSQSSVKNMVRVIEITKLVEEKRGGGVSVSVENFEGRNLIFVDEGHKGSGGEAWRKYRDALGAIGFTFEYSATFGQALSAARNDPLTAEYGKAIIFDYSYRYFYSDGFGKDFRILNLRDETDAEKTDVLLMGNLLSFYEQVRLYEDQQEALRPYNLEKPLWVFVGSTVNAVYLENKQPRSDVLTVVRFLRRVLSDRTWAVATIHSILEGKTGLVSPDGQDVFAGQFTYLRQLGKMEELYEDILQRIFHTSAGRGLHLATIKGSPGELGLKAAGSGNYFGLIYIGDPSAFKKLVEESNEGITLEEDAITASLFERINYPDSGIYILIGAKKFIEGWNSWRVSSMGLLNIGQNEGPQIIQLFGRGVRLKGQAMSLKRSAALEGKHPQHIRVLETLNIFAVRANYMAQFREYLEREGVEVEPPYEIHLPVIVNKAFLKRGLVIPRLPSGRDFTRERVLLLEPDRSIRVVIDFSVRVQKLESGANRSQTDRARREQGQKIPLESLAWVDWQQVYLDLIAYKERKGWRNLVIRPETPRQIIEQLNHEIVAEESVLSPKSFADCMRLQYAVTQLLCRYMEQFYRKKREQWEAQIMEYQELESDDPNISFNKIGKRQRPSYTLRILRSESKLIEDIEKLRRKLLILYRRETTELPRLHFDRHIYIPLLLEREGITMNPPGLTKSEADFVRDLCAYWKAEKDKALAGKELFLLRNLSRGRGIGFFEESGFYPDFILWVLYTKENTQRIVFVEPHGMLYAKAYFHDEKARLWERLRELESKIRERSKCLDIDIRLDAFIISATPYDQLRKRYGDGNWCREKFREHHILFPERTNEYDYLKLLLEDRSSSVRESPVKDC